MEISLTGANFGLLGGLIVLCILLFLLRGFLNLAAIIIIILLVAPIFGIGFMGSLDVGSALGGRQTAPLTDAQEQLLDIYQTKSGFTDAEVVPAIQLINKARGGRGIAGFTTAELQSYAAYYQKFNLLTKAEQSHFTQLAAQKAAVEGVFTGADALAMVELLKKSTMSGPEYDRYYRLYQTRLQRIATGQQLARAQSLQLAVLEKKLNDNLTTDEANQLAGLYKKRNPLQTGQGGLVGALIHYSKAILSWAFDSFGASFFQQMPGTTPQITP